MRLRSAGAREQRRDVHHMAAARSSTPTPGLHRRRIRRPRSLFVVSRAGSVTFADRLQPFGLR